MRRIRTKEKENYLGTRIQMSTPTPPIVDLKYVQVRVLFYPKDALQHWGYDKMPREEEKL